MRCGQARAASSVGAKFGDSGTWSVSNNYTMKYWSYDPDRVVTGNLVATSSKCRYLPVCAAYLWQPQTVSCKPSAPRQWVLNTTFIQHPYCDLDFMATILAISFRAVIMSHQTRWCESEDSTPPIRNLYIDSLLYP
jgi:hypothetical protein